MIPAASPYLVQLAFSIASSIVLETQKVALGQRLAIHNSKTKVPNDVCEKFDALELHKGHHRAKDLILSDLHVLL
jgi:hypothetical protein